MAKMLLVTLTEGTDWTKVARELIGTKFISAVEGVDIDTMERQIAYMRAQADLRERLWEMLSSNPL